MNLEIKVKYYFYEDDDPIRATLNQIETGRLNNILYGSNPYRLKARCLFTGLYDKHGAEIYEGDIVKNWINEDNYDLGVIIWLGVEFMMSYDGTENDITYIPNERTLEVIGNIHHKNAKLLKQ